MPGVVPIGFLNQDAVQRAQLRCGAAVNGCAREFTVEAYAVVLPMGASGATTTVIAADRIVNAFMTRLNSVPKPRIQALLKERRQSADLRFRMPTPKLFG